MKLQHNPTYVNLLPRLSAAIIDTAIPSLIVWYYYTQLVALTSLSSLLARLPTLIAYVFLPIPVVVAIVFLITLKSTGYTPGKWLMGIKIVDHKHQLLSWLPLLLREWVAKKVSASILLLGFLSIPFDSNHQGWHDHLVGSYALKTRTQLLPGYVITLVVLGLQFFLIGKTITSLLGNTELIGDLTFIIEPLLQLIPR